MKIESIQLGKVCKFLNGGTPTRENVAYFNGDIPWITGADITSFLVRKVRSFITEKAIKDSATNLVPAGTVLLVTRTSVGKVAVAGMPLCFSQDITAIRNDEKHLDKSFLIYFLKTKEPYFKQSARGATIGGITREVVSQVEIPLPSLDEQKRIAAILDKADRLRRGRRFAQTLADSFLQSVFIKMFGDPMSNSMNWEKYLFEEVCKTRLGKMLDQSRETGTKNKLYLRNTNVKWMQFDLSEVFEMDFDESEYNKFRLKKGDVLICEGGEIGRSAIWNNELPECYFQKALHRARPDTTKANANFIVNLMKCLADNDGFRDFSTQATIAHLTGEKLASMPIIVPPLPLQEKFAEIVQKFERVRRQQREAVRQAEHLFQTLLHRAFRGEL